MTETALDRAHDAMQAAEGDDAARLRFFDRLADAELFVMLMREAEGDHIEPQVFGLEEGTFVLAFDTEARLSEFAGGITPYAALPGRVLAQLLAENELGLGLNLEVAPSAILLPTSAMAWLARTLRETPEQMQERPVRISRPGALPEALLLALDAKLPVAAGMAAHALLAAVEYEGGRRGHLLAFVDPARGAETALARRAGEALVFSGLDAGQMDVGFFASTDPIVARLAAVALRFDLPLPDPAIAPSAPGSDPQKPPRLR